MNRHFALPHAPTALETFGSQVSVSISDRAARAHALKNALSVISAVADLVTPALSAADRRRMDRLYRAVGHILALIQDDLNQASVRATTPARTTIHVEDLVNVVRESVQDRIDRVGVRLLTQCSGGVLWGDGPALQETLLNLVTNAIEATEPERTVRLETRQTAEGDQLWTIENPGTGIPADVLRQFGVGNRSLRPGGSGIGVMFSSSVVQRHGGWLRFESREAEGTIATVWLPRDGRERREPGGKAREDSG
jgi:signal transduction histidine kinase